MTTSKASSHAVTGAVPSHAEVMLDPSHDIFQYQSHPLDAIFKPTNVAVLGATEKEGSVGRTLMKNLIANSFGGAVFPVNPKRNSVMGIKAYPTIADVPDPVDLAVVVTPAGAAPQLVKECAAAGVKGMIIISAGFKEIGPEGEALEQEIMATARAVNMRIIGPNCLGVMNPIFGMNATFAADMAQPGNVAFISQSGALGTAVLDWSLAENVGFSAFVSIGSMMDVDWGDLIQYLGNDPNTQSIVLYMESVGDPRSFLSAAREVSLTKPIIVIKPGRSEAASKAAASHTGALTGSDDVLEAAFERCGVLRVERIAELFSMAEILSKQPRPEGPRLTILTNAGGPGVLATDALIGSNGELTQLSETTYEQLNKVLPTHWSHNNPVDVLGDASPERYAEALRIAAEDPNSDGLLVILTPQDMTDATETAVQLAPYSQTFGKPVLASWMGGPSVMEGVRILNGAGIPTFEHPDKACRVFGYMWRNTDSLRMLYQTPRLSAFHSEEAVQQKQKVHDFLTQVRAEGRTLLTEAESKQLLEAYEIPTTKTMIAETKEKAIEAANVMGYPVVLKLHSETITHKTDVGGVKLNLTSPEAVADAFEAIRNKVVELHSAADFMGVTVQPMISLKGYEIILGSSMDPQFGPVLLFGTGGQLVEVYQDRALGLPPLNNNLARRMMEKTKIYKALKGVRGQKPVDLEQLEALVVRFSQLIVEQPLIAEMDLNPILASSEGLLALDARVVLHDPSIPENKLPKPAIRPYPGQYIANWTATNQTPMTLRPILPEDEALMRQFHLSLSDRTVYLRFMQAFDLNERITHERLSRICFNDYDREIALVAEYGNPTEGNQALAGVGRLRKSTHGGEEATFRVLVADAWQGKGVGTALMKQLIHVAKQEGVKQLVGEMLTENQSMQIICEELGFKISAAKEPGIQVATLLL